MDGCAAKPGRRLGAQEWHGGDIGARASQVMPASYGPQLSRTGTSIPLPSPSSDMPSMPTTEAALKACMGEGSGGGLTHSLG